MAVKWGIAAAGRITHDFVTALGTLNSEHHKVVAVSDPDIERAKSFAEKHQIEKFYGSFAELATDPDVEIVYIGTLNPFHYMIAKLMLDSNKHVLCEKPICLNYADAESLYTLAYAKKLFLMEGMWSRFFPSYDYLRKILSQKKIGNIRSIQVEHGFVAKDIERINSRQLGGSITLDIGLYGIQLGQLVFDKYPEKIVAKGIVNDNQVDIESEIKLMYGNNKELKIFVSGVKELKNEAVIQGDQGKIIMQNYWCCTKIIESDGAVNEWPLPDNAKFPLIHTNSCGLRYEAEEVRKCLKNNLCESSLYTWKNSMELVSIEDEIRRQLGVSYD